MGTTIGRGSGSDERRSDERREGPTARPSRAVGVTSLRDWLGRLGMATEITTTVQVVVDLTLYLSHREEEPGTPALGIEVALPGGADSGRRYVLMGELEAVRRVRGETPATIGPLLAALFRLDAGALVWREELREDV